MDRPDSDPANASPPGFPAREAWRQRCGELLDRVDPSRDASVAAAPLGEGRWALAIAGADQVGILSAIAALLTGHGIQILRGDVATRHEPAARKGSFGRVLDVFEVASPRELDEAFWTGFQEDLRRQIGLILAGEEEAAFGELVDRVSAVIGSLAPPGEALLPVEVTFDNDSDASCTALHITSADTPGFLFAFANALSMLRTVIERAEIRTVDDEVRDTFWIRDRRGEKITDPAWQRELRVASVLLKQFAHLLPVCADPGQALRQFRDLVSHVLQGPARLDDVQSLRSLDAMGTLAEMMGVSRFLWEDFLRMQHENLFPVVTKLPADPPGENQPPLAERLRGELAAADSEDRAVVLLNDFKDREMFRTDLRHITRRIGDAQFARELGDLGDVVVAGALELCHAHLAGKLGRPRLADGEPCRSSALALGKFGGREMGFASDVELLFVYEGPGQTDGPGPAANQVYFDQLVQRMLRVLKSRQKGIFEVDLRLRPYGGKGPLAISLDRFRKYYCPAGEARQFERMALVKLRPVTGEAEFRDEILAARDRFVYSGEPLDYGNILHLRDRQAGELVAPGAVNAKYSPGGLVDLEYFVQAMQITFGRDRPSVRVPNTMAALAALQAAEALEADFARDLHAAYAFLRRLIDALRAVRGNAKDLAIPPADSRAFAYLARRLRYDDAAQLTSDLDQAMEFARHVWDPYRTP